MWAQGAHGQGGALDPTSYAELSKPSSYVKPMTYGSVAPNLFDAIVANKVPPNPVPPPAHNPPAAPAGA
jgi:cytochrome o ubiquinol oxidase subunit 2